MIQTEIFKDQNLLQFLAPLYVAMPLSRQLQDLLKRYQVELSDQELTDRLYKSIIRHLRTEGRKAVKASLIKYLLEELEVYEDTENLPPRNIEELLTARALMEKIKTGKKSEPIAKTVVRLLMPYRKTVKTITTDNGSEFASHQLITKGLHIKGKDDVIVYFADAYSSWQKGCVENTNKLIRRYIPKHTDFNLVSPQKIMNIQKKLNNRSREKLNFDTPKFCFFKNFD